MSATLLSAPSPAVIDAALDLAFGEDLGHGTDVTTLACVPADAVGTADVVSREVGVLAGGSAAIAAFRRQCGAGLEVVDCLPDGAALDARTVALTVRGPLRGLLTAERTALNLLCHLSGVASTTRQWVDAVAGTGARVRDTRKTLPGLRGLEKYAVRCGGGVNHRMSLGDAALIKDNHVASAGSVRAAIEAVRKHSPGVPLEVEVDTLAQLDEALDAGATLILLDNFSLADTLEAVLRRGPVSGVELEASGGLTLDRARTVAATGVDYLAVGALTASARSLDLGLDLRTD